MTESRKNSNDRVLLQASKWAARESAGDMTRLEQEELAAWLAANAEHQKAYLDICKTSGLLDHFAGEQGKEILANAAPELQNLVAQCDDLAVTQKKIRPGHLYKWVSLAASILVVLVSAVLFLQNAPTATTYQTRVGGSETILLKDGSVITLNTDTRLSVALSDSERRILLDHGEAYFEVAKDRTKPFSVIIGKDIVRAVGTAFNIKRRADVTKVTVTEGVVEVNSAAPAAAEAQNRIAFPVALTVGEGMTIHPAGIHAAKLAPAEVENAVSWRTGINDFNGRKLSLIVEDLQYYADKEIILASEQVGDLVVGGSFITSNVSSFLKGLEQTFPIKIIERDSVIIISYAQKGHQTARSLKS